MSAALAIAPQSQASLTTGDATIATPYATRRAAARLAWIEAAAAALQAAAGDKRGGRVVDLLLTALDTRYPNDAAMMAGDALAAAPGHLRDATRRAADAAGVWAGVAWGIAPT